MILKRNFSYRSILLTFCLPAVANASLLKPDNTDNLFNRQIQHQQAQQQQFDAKAPDVSLLPPVVKTQLKFPTETPCFTIEHVSITGQESLPHWVPIKRLANQAVGHCIGVEGINLLVTDVQNRLISHGWITSRVLVPEQDLSTGVLQLVVMPGKVQKVIFTDDSSQYSTLYTAIPAHSGNLLDLRDIEQGLENLQRLPTVQASMEMVPGDGPGETQIVIKREQSRYWHAGAWVDNTGSKSTGKNQAGVMLALDNPTSLSDLFYLTATRDLSFSSDKDTTNYSAHYSVPFGYWQFATTASDYEYTQTIAGANNDIEYRGKSKSLNLQLSNTQTVDGKNESKGSSIGAGLSTGGWNVNASVNKGSGFEKGDSQFYTDTEVTAGKQLTLNSGKDTTLIGAHASGETVKANVGGDLTLSSQQVTDKYDSKQQSGSVSGSIGSGLNTSASVNANKTEMHSDYQSVDKQTGINAGKGGFDITVGNHTQLDGAVISSTAEADKNTLDTGTLGFGDIKNKAEYKVDSQSGGFSTGGSPFADQLAGKSTVRLGEWG
ncbi:ShlB/FhaC/HecB family hemolysin secretion/activation protein [Providencia rettgeri]|nr:ShlB/FhaC/HecB family hemolysin secretion/activation protein [Providencia rettgeri]MDK7745427.1 ShlB/FhaC/HecB family hemolysin secretion/activation protein [Providencia rettgeri]MDK7757899.1 ShlB/FhaC/HecB family hemolysin secretion/activation protein [Providencia rettgeri]